LALLRLRYEIKPNHKKNHDRPELVIGIVALLFILSCKIGRKHEVEAEATQNTTSRWIVRAEAIGADGITCTEVCRDFIALSWVRSNQSSNAGLFSDGAEIRDLLAGVNAISDAIRIMISAWRLAIARGGLLIG
jgi:hypothetical protein